MQIQMQTRFMGPKESIGPKLRLGDYKTDESLEAKCSQGTLCPAPGVSGAGPEAFEKQTVGESRVRWTPLVGGQLWVN